MSRTIDERVVKMEFDNQRFESNVKESLSTIDKLKKSMDFDSAKAFGNIDKAASKVSFSGLLSGIETVRSKFSMLDVASYTVMSRITNSLIDFGKKIVTAIPSQIKEGGISRALNIEQAKFQLEGLKVSWDSIKDDIEYGVKDTAYGLDEAAKAASQLVASGVKVGDEMANTLRGISGVAAMTNSSYSEISHIFTTAAGQGKVMTMQLRELENRGLNAAATLAKSMGTSEAAVRDMVTKGKIDFKTFSDAMNEAFGEHATAANQTFSGALANMKAALSRIGADFASPALRNLRDIFNELRNTFNNVRTALGPVVEVFDRMFSTIKRSLVGNLKNLNEWFSKFGGKEKVIESVNWALSALLNRLVPIKKAFETVFPKSTVNTLDGMASAVERFTKSLMPTQVELEALYYIFIGLFNTIKIIGKLLKTIAAGLVKFGPVLAPLTTLVGLFVIFGMTLGKIVPKVVSFINTIRMLLPLLKVLGIVAAGALAVLGGIVIVKTIVANFDKIKAAFKSLGLSISNWFNDLKSKYPLLQKISDFFAGLGVKLKNVGSAIAQFAKMAYNAFSQNGFIGGFKKLGEQLRATVEGVNRVKRRSVEMADAYNLAAKRTGKAVSVTIGEEETAFQKFARILVTIGDKVKAFFENIKKVLTIENIKKGFHNLGESMHNAFTKIGNALKNSGIIDGLSKVGQKVVEFARNLDYGKIAAIGFATALISVIFKFGNLLGGVGTLTKETGLFIRSLRKRLFNLSLIKTQPLNNLAASIAIIAGSIGVLVAVYGENKDAFLKVTSVLLALGMALVTFSVIAGKLKSFKNFSIAMLGLAAGVGILAGAMVLLNALVMDENTLKKLGILGLILAALVIAMQQTVHMDVKSAKNIAYAIAFAVSVAILIKSLVKAFKELHYMGWQGMLSVAVGLGMVMSALSLLAFTMGKIKNVGSTLGILAFTAFIAVFANSLNKVFDALPSWKLKSYLEVIDTYKVIVTELGVLAIVMLGVASMAGEGIQKLGTGLLAMAAAVGVIAFVVVKMTEWAKTLTAADIGPVVAALTIVGALIALCALFQRLSTKTIKLGEDIKQVNLGWTFIALGAAVLMMSKAVQMIAKVPTEQFTEVVTILGVMGGIVAGITALSFLTEKANAKAILSIAVVIGSLSLSLMLLSLFTWDDILPGLVSLGVCMGALAAVFFSMNKLQPNKNVVKTLIPVAVMLGTLGAALIVLSNLPWPSVLVAGAAIAGSMVVLAVILKTISGGSGLGRSDTYKNKIAMLITVAGLIGALGASLYWASKNNWTQILTASAGMAGAILSLAVLLKTVSGMKNVNTAIKSKMAILITLVGAIGAIAASLYLVSKNNFAQIISASAGLAGCMLALAAVVKIINSCDPNAKMALELAALAAVMVGIGVSLAIISRQPWQSMAASAIILGAVIAELVVIAKVISKAETNLKKVGELALIAGLLYEIAYPIYKISKLGNIKDMVSTAILLSALIWEMVGISAIMKKINPSMWDAGALALASGSMLIIAISMAKIGEVIKNPTAMIAAAGGLAIAMGAIAASLIIFAKVVNGWDLAGAAVGAAGIIIVANACVNLAKAMKMLKGVDWKEFELMASAVGGIVAILAILGLVTGALVDVAGIGIFLMIAMVAIAGAFALFAHGVEMLGNAMSLAGQGIKMGAEGLKMLVPIMDKLVSMEMWDVAAAMGKLALGLLALGAAGIVLIPGALGFAAFGMALQSGFLPGILSLCEVSEKQLEPLAANIRILVDSLKPMKELGFELIPVGVAFTLFGAALALAGYGINQGAQGLYILAPALTQLQPILTEEFVGQMINLATGLAAIGGSGIILGMGAIGMMMGGVGLQMLSTGLSAMTAISADSEALATALEGLSSGLTKIGGAGIILGLGSIGLMLGGVALLVLLPALLALTSGKIDMAAVGQQFETLAKGSFAFAEAGILLMIGAPGVLAAAAAILVLGSSLNTFQAQFTTAVTNMDKTIANMSKQSLNTAKTKYKTVGQAMPQSVAAGIREASPKMQVAAKKAGSSVERVIKQSTGGGTTSSTNIFGMIGQAITGSLGMGMEKNEGGILSNVGGFANKIQNILANVGSNIMKLLGLSDGLSGLAADFGLIADQYDERGFKMTQGALSVENAFKKLGLDFDDINEQFEEMIPNMEDVTGGLGDMGGAAGKAGNSFESLRDTIEQQMDIFSEFNMKTEITGDQMLANMRSQVQGVAQWAANLQMLAARGIDQGLLAKLSELGPQGYEKVAAFVSMTDAQLQEANQLYATSLVLPSSAAAQITGSFAMAGKNASAGFLGAINNQEAYDALWSFGDSGLSGVKDVYGIASPSREMENIGMYTMQGMRNGISHNEFLPINQMRSTAQKIVRAARETLTYAEFRTIGENVMKGLHDGLDAGSDSVIAKMNAVADALIAKANSVLEMGSPSRAFYRIGRFVDLGLRNGIAQNAYEPVNAMDNLTNQLTYKLGSIAMTINELLNEDLDAQPTITPVLDLTNLQNGIGVASSLLASRTVRLSATQASIQNGTGSAEIKTNGSGNTVYTFTQNNYSPKALDRSEIYRQTRNQFSQIKQARV